MWKYYALLSAFFAALTAIFAKVGVKDINSDLATAIRTTIILVITWGIVFVGNHQMEVKSIPSHTWIFLFLSGCATGLSWLFYFKAIQLGDVSRVAPIDECGHYYLSFIPVPEGAGKSEDHSWSLSHYGRQYRDAL